MDIYTDEALVELKGLLSDDNRNIRLEAARELLKFAVTTENFPRDRR